jgi:glycosyltransferase involved in cell wall biosynthesis
MIISALATVFSRVKVFWHFHSHEFDAPFHSKMALMACARTAAVRKITFVNKELQNYLFREFHLQPNKLVLLYNSTGIAWREQETSRPQGPLVIGYVGRLVALKRVHYLVSLAEELLKKGSRHFEVWIIGDGAEAGNLKKEVESKTLNGIVKFYGFQENTEKYYRRFDLFILPSAEECLSIALIDAGYCGVPALAFNVGGNNEIVLHEKSGYIVSSRAELLERANALLNDGGLRARLGATARSHCEKMFGPLARKENLMALTENVD